MRIIKLVIWGMIFLLVPGTPSLSFDPWELVKKKNGISVYVNKSGKPKFPPLKAITIIQEPFETILLTLRNYDTYPRWQPFMKTFKVLKSYDDNHAIFYALFDFPWPILNRDLVVENTIEEISSSPLTLKIHLKNTDFPLPEQKKNNLRFDYYRSEIVIEKIGETQTKMTIIIESDPGGHLPVIAVNWTMRETVYRALLNLKLDVQIFKKFVQIQGGKKF